MLIKLIGICGKSLLFLTSTNTLYPLISFFVVTVKSNIFLIVILNNDDMLYPQIVEDITRMLS